MNEPKILIVGAGPTGLTLALFLVRAGVLPRIIDKKTGPGLASRAMAVQARTLEFYRQLGFADEVVHKGIPIEQISIRSGGKVAAQFSIEDFGEGLSPYPFILSFPQDDHEKLLVEKLADAGVAVEWETELLQAREIGGGVQATLRKPDETEEVCSAAYVCGCDGSRSVVRQDLGLDFAGGTYDKTYYVADVKATGEAIGLHTFNLCVTASDMLLVLPVRSSGMNRLIGVLPHEAAARENVTFEDVRAFAESASGIHVDQVNWFSTYKAHHRVATHFRVGRQFISGDAGHIHSPVGGQGMNTGIGDAVNLAWKLAAVVQGRADAAILDTYEPERIAFARSLVATTDKVFQLGTGSGTASHAFRETILPHLAPFALGFESDRTAAFRLLSQTRIHYGDSALSEGAAGSVHGGDRLPWVPGSEVDGGDGTDENFAPLQSLDWQIHVYGDVRDALRTTAENARLPLHTFPWTPAAEKAGLDKDALFLVRPDGYVAFADARQDAAKLTAYLDRFKITPRRD